MLNVAIVDDDKESLDLIQSYIQRYGAAHDVAFNVSRFDNPLKFLGGFDSGYDIVFLDIDMPELDGMSAARQMRKMDEVVALVFVTNMAQFAIHGYEVDADDFIVKPVAYGSFELKLARVIKKNVKKEKTYVTVYDNDMAKYVALDDIRYVEVQKHYLEYHTASGVFGKRGTLKKEEPFLSENGFAKCNNYCMVNLKYVLGINGFSLHVATGGGSDKYEELAISHPRKKEFVRTLNSYLEEHL